MAAIAAAILPALASAAAPVAAGTAAAGAAGAAAGLIPVVGSAGAAAGILPTAAAAGGLFAGGSVVSSILSGGASALSILTGLGAADEKATALELEGADAVGEISTETIQGLERRASLKKSLQEAIGEIDTAYAASGVDLSFGTPSEARKEAYREADQALSVDNETTRMRTGRLMERARLYRLQARSVRSGALVNAVGQGVQAGLGIAARG